MAPAPEKSSRDLKRDNCDLPVSLPFPQDYSDLVQKYPGWLFQRDEDLHIQDVISGHRLWSSALVERKIEGEPHLNCQDITDNHFLYKTTVRMVIKRYLDCWNDLSAWVPFNLTDAIKDPQMRCFRELLNFSMTMD